MDARPQDKLDEGFRVRSWIVWATGLLAYIVAVLDRTTLGVSGLDAADRFGASPSMLSTFVVLQVIVYAGAQVPAGLLLDRFGSKALIVCGAALMAAGQLVLAFSESLPAAIAARAVVGLGDAVMFISVLRLVPYWFKPRQVPLVTQLTGICGQLGQVLSALPFLAVLTDAGWTAAYVSVAMIGVLSIALTLALVKNTPNARAVATEATTIRDTLASVKTVWLRPGTRLGFFTHMGTQFSVTVFALMWGVPYLTVAQGMSTGVAGSLLTISVVAPSRPALPSASSRAVIRVGAPAWCWPSSLATPWPGPSCWRCPDRRRSGCWSC
jgi:MFS family permease